MPRMRSKLARMEPSSDAWTMRISSLTSAMLSTSKRQQKIKIADQEGSGQRRSAAREWAEPRCIGRWTYMLPNS